MEIPAADIKTNEVLNWQGIHLLHYPMSSCSQKVRILLGEKQIPWTSHPVDLSKGQQKSDWYLGINPKGVVPVLVHDGRVINESNDILVYLDTRFPSAAGSYLPVSDEEKSTAEALLRLEDGLHAQLRAITFTFVMPGQLMNHHFTDAEVDHAVQRFDAVFQEIDERLMRSPYLCGERITLPDIAWFITFHRLALAGYPLERRPYLASYYRHLGKRPAFKKEAAAGAILPSIIGSLFRFLNRIRGAGLNHRLATLLSNERPAPRPGL